MGKRVNTAQWMEKQKRWQIKVQKDNERKAFYSSKPGRAGQREANAKADAWLDDGVENQNLKVSVLYKQYLESVKLRTSDENYEKLERDGRNHILPVIGNKKISVLNEQNLQRVIDIAASKKLSYKTLKNIRAAMSGFLKYCRLSKVTTLCIENIILPQSAPTKQKNILQPKDLKILFSSDKTMFRGKVVTDPFIYAYRFEVLTGLRPGELVGLEWDDDCGDQLKLTRSINKKRQVTSGKNKNAVRPVILFDLARKVLDQQKTISNGKRIFEIPSSDVPK